MPQCMHDHHLHIDHHHLHPPPSSSFSSSLLYAIRQWTACTYNSSLGGRGRWGQIRIQQGVLWMDQGFAWTDQDSGQARALAEPGSAVEIYKYVHVMLSVIVMCGVGGPRSLPG